MPRVLVALIFAFCGAAFAAPPAVTLRPVASGLTLPVEIAHAGDGSGRLFVVEQGGAIKIIKDGAKADVLWRHATLGENDLYPMNGTAIKPTEGYIRTVPVANWLVVSR